MSPLLQQVLERKRQRRRELAALPFPAKVKIVERMREALSSVRTATRPEQPRASVPRT